MLSVFNQSYPYEALLGDLRSKGWSIQDNFFSEDFIKILAQEASDMDKADMQQAGIGRMAGHQVDLKARRDAIQWIDPDNAVRKMFLDAMESLRVALNRALFMGLFDYEAHFARYERLAFYEKHLDAFKGKSNRVLSTVLYLNEHWGEQDGGEFVLYDEGDSQVELGRFLPVKGRFAVFLSESFYHEVLPANRPRHSIAGWFRVNNTTGMSLDPDR